MQPWKISAGLTAALAGSAFLLGGSRLEYLAPHWPAILAGHGVALFLHAVLALTAVAATIYAIARTTGTRRPRPPRRSRRAVRTAWRGRCWPRRRAPQGRRR